MKRICPFSAALLSVCLIVGLPGALRAEPAADAPVQAASAASAASAAAVSASAAPAPGLPAAAEAFQGLAWGATEAQIAERFGSRLSRAACDVAARQAAALLAEACDVPLIARYDVAGIPFVLRLHLSSADRTLVRVTLTHAVEGARGDDARWSEQHRALRRLLSQRYGGAESTDVSTEAGMTTAFARWRRGHTIIELHSQVFRAAGAAVSGREQAQVVYLNVLQGEAGKL